MALATSQRRASSTAQESVEEKEGKDAKSIDKLSLAVFTMAAFGADNSFGTWKLNISKSKFDHGPAPVKSLTSTREAADGGVKVTTTREQANGTPINSSYTAKYDGTEAPVTGAPWDTIAIKQENADTFTATFKKGERFSQIPEWSFLRMVRP